MLIAYNNQQQLFLPYQYTRKALQRYRRQMTFLPSMFRTSSIENRKL